MVVTCSAVFSPGAIDKAPKTFVVVAHVGTPKDMAFIQRDVVKRFPNASSIDLSLIRKTVADITERVSLAVRFLAPNQMNQINRRLLRNRARLHIPNL